MARAASDDSLHAVLSRGHRPDLEDVDRQRCEIEAHVGRFIITWGLVDLQLGIAVSALSNPGDPGRRQRTLRKTTTTKQKIALLRGLLPPGWADGNALLALLDSGNAYRNALAHPVLGSSGVHGGKRYGWHLWRIDDEALPVLELDEATLRCQERDSRVAVEAVGCLAADNYISARGTADLAAHPLGAAVLARPGEWRTEEEYAEFQSRVRELFET